MYMVEKLDAGDIISQIKFLLKTQMIQARFFHTLSEAGVSLLKRNTTFYS